jgi:2-oxoacid:acceptor oxidoreductase delta subunit (pyruvate/2-ketoisovalerate family)
MAKGKRSEDELRVYQFRSHAELPPLPMSLGTTLINKTGSWRYMRPVYEDKTAPCIEGCPASEDIQAYMYWVARGEFEKAWETIMEENPFPAVCGRVCYHPCEMNCNRGEYDEALSINAVERFIGDFGLEFSLDRFKVREERKERIAVVGAGPAGLTCAYHLRRLGYQVVVFEMHEKPGGVLQYGIPAYRLPKDILEKEIRRLEDFGVRIETRTKVGLHVKWEELLKYDAVFLATGVHKGRELNIPGENMPGVLSGLEFLSKVNRGEKVELGRRVAVIGGGNTAMDAARTALRLGSTPIIFYRRTRAEMPAIQDEIEEAEREGIRMEFLVSPIRIIGENGRVTGLKLQRMELGEPDESGRRRPIPVLGSEYTVEVDNVITAIGEAADFSFLPSELVDGGVVKTDIYGQTGVAKVFAGGDIVEQPHTVVHAIGSGKKAAMAIDAFLQKKSLEDDVRKIQVGYKGGFSFRRYRNGTLEGDPVNNLKVVTFEHVNTWYFDHIHRNPVPEKAVEERTRDFREVKETFSSDTAVQEAKRCFNCGVCNMCDNCLIFCPDVAIRRRESGYRYEFDYDYCKGCGICVAECPRNAITMVPEGR